MKKENLTAIEAIKYLLKHNEDFSEEQELTLNLTLKTVHLLSCEQINEIIYSAHVDYLVKPVNQEKTLWNIRSKKDYDEYMSGRDTTSPHPELEPWEVIEINRIFREN
jgi:hypothetical protein